MSLTPNTRLGPYEILAPLGAGGMGEVYRAKDTRLDREVAVKVLPERVAANRDALARFQREAQAVAALSHPNILAIHDVGTDQGISYVVTELLEGETLRDGLRRAALPWSKAVEVGAAVADGLAAAHAKGVIHRDLKPENIFLTKDGVVKILDFGLARIDKPQATEDRHDATTVTLDTKPGAVFGTVHYMSPEQVRGHKTDARSDIFSFGCVLYEMVSGRRPFSGDTSADTMTAILKEEPPRLALSNPDAAPELARVITRCLEKRAEQRIQSARDLSYALRDILADSGASRSPVAMGAPLRRNRIGMFAWGLAAVGLAVVIGFGILYVSEPVVPRRVVRFSISPPPGGTFMPSAISVVNSPAFAVSPDGRCLAFLARIGTEQSSIWVRPLDSVVARRLAGTEGAALPFWSADSRAIGFSAAGKLRTIEVVGGAVRVLCNAPTLGGGTWNREGTIVFQPNQDGPLHRVSAEGGTPVPVRSSDSPSGKLASARFPSFLPDGRHFLFFNAPGTVLVGSLDAEDASFLLNADSTPSYASGYLLFQRQGTLLAQSFDPKRLELTGDATPIAEGLAFGSTGLGRFSASASGHLAFRTAADAETVLRWFDRQGKEMGTVGPATGYVNLNPTLSPDGTRLMISRQARGERTFDLWQFDLSREYISSRFTFDAGTEWLPAWSPDGQYVAFTMDHGTLKHDIYRRLASGTGDDELVFASPSSKTVTDWTPDGKFLVFDEPTETGSDLSYVPVSGDRKPVSYLRTKFNEQNPHVSPDGRWLAYQSDESGRYEIYVRPFPDAERGKVQVSKEGGIDPRWSHDGTELFYFSGNDRLMASTVRTDQSHFTVLTSDPLFHVRKTTNRTSYTVTTDGQRFLINTVAATIEAPITVVLDWTAALQN